VRAEKTKITNLRFHKKADALLLPEVTLLQLTLLHLLSSLRTALSQDQNCTEEKPYNSCCNGCGYTFDSAKGTLAIYEFFSFNVFATPRSKTLL
jgi:hypothetical protein